MKIKTTRRRILVRITSEQIHRRNHIPLQDGKELEIIDSINPNNWSVEEATVESVPEGHTFFAPGDRVLIDFSVLTAGMYPEMQMTSVTRIIESTPDYTILWAYCGADIASATEIHAKIVIENGQEKLIPYPDTIIIPIVEEKKENFEKCGLLYVPVETFDTREKTFKAKVLFSGVDGIESEQLVWVKGGNSIPINHPDWKVEYVDRSAILAVA